MPVSETTINKKDKDRSWWAVAGIGLGIVIILLLIMFVVSVLRSNSANQQAATVIPAGSIVALDTSDPDTAIKKVNSQLVQTVQSIQTDDPNAAFTAILTALVGDQTSATTANLGLTYIMEDAKGTTQVEFKGDIQRLSDTQTALQGTANVRIQTSDIPDLTLPVDLVLANQRLYIRINDPIGNMPAEYTYLGLLEGKWIKIDLQSYVALPGVAGNESAQDLLDSQNRQDLLQLWSTNPPLINPQAAPLRTVSGINLECVTAEMNPQAFKDTKAAQDYPPLELCTNEAKTPVYIGVVTEQNNQRTDLGLTFFSFGQPVTITEPTEDVVDLSGLLGGTP